MYKDELLQLILVQNMNIHSHTNQFSFTCYQQKRVNKTANISESISQRSHEITAMSF